MRRLVEHDGACTGALFQTDWGTPYRKPTRLLGRWPGLEKILHLGLPDISDDNAYRGPLPEMTPVKVKLLGQKNGKFRTGPSAAWPPRLCERLAKLLLQAFLEAVRGLTLQSS